MDVAQANKDLVKASGRCCDRFCSIDDLVNGQNPHVRVYTFLGFHTFAMDTVLSYVRFQRCRPVPNFRVAR